MSEEWDKLWLEPEGYIISQWQTRVKTEGDKQKETIRSLLIHGKLLREENDAITIRMDALQFCLDHCAESFDEQTKKLEAIRALNEALYEALPSGKVDAFELIKLIGSHYEQVAEVLGE